MLPLVRLSSSPLLPGAVSSHPSGCLSQVPHVRTLPPVGSCSEELPGCLASGQVLMTDSPSRKTARLLLDPVVSPSVAWL